MNRYLLHILLISLIIFPFDRSYASPSLFETVIQQQGCVLDTNMDVPKQRTKIWNASSEYGDRVLNHWTNRSLDEIKQSGKVDAPRVLLANLFANKNISETNAFILNMQVNGVSGTRWALNKNGDYDFSLTILTAILWKFGDHPSILFPATANYLLNVLMIESGNEFRYATPKTWGLLRETEND